MTTGKKAHQKAVKKACSEGGKSRFPCLQEHTYCYCHALDLTYPHYMAEHTQDHDDARELRARRAGGAK